jgi:hypothetical protein
MYMTLPVPTDPSSLEAVYADVATAGVDLHRKGLRDMS